MSLIAIKSRKIKQIEWTKEEGIDQYLILGPNLAMMTHFGPKQVIIIVDLRFMA